MESQPERSVQEIALCNPIILTKILSQSSAPLKSCRLVSHFWNDTVLSLPNTRLALKLNQNQDDERDPVSFLELCYKLDDRLAKRIYAATSHLNEVTFYFATKLIHLCDKFSDQVQVLEISIYYEASLQSVFLVLKNSCPNLKQLRVRCSFSEYDVPSGETLEGPMLSLPSLTVFELNSSVVAPSPILTCFAKLVVNASPNLKKVTLPWGIYPDLETSKFLDSLTLELDDVRPLDDVLTQLKPSELTRMLNQIGDQLVHLSFSYCNISNEWESMQEDNDLDTSTPSGFRLKKKMSKLRRFENDMVDIIQHYDLWRDIERMQALESLRIGKISKKSTSVNAVLKNLSETERIFTKVTDLKIHELYDPDLLEGLKTAFPNLESLALDTFHEEEEDEEKARMELDVVLETCAGFDKLTHLHLWLPTYPEQTWEVLTALFNAVGLDTLVINTHSQNHTRHDLTDGDGYMLDLFKTLIVAMSYMDKVVINDLYLRQARTDDASRWSAGSRPNGRTGAPYTLDIIGLSHAER
ncbi:uncharacterized protein LOC118433514 isoform X2 [Folsomia candida]|uniref:F-box domain-containing protein n=1 Tax=Folsomia candida TaxID=158441 RepID=A0A226CZS8_FOLCA|nr:uncharacterized protein LOC118433514 isoform X2 [Folsomia candida]OXA37536.1 hypothetical protein Fcan01_27650 [Folsomia candida]